MNKSTNNKLVIIKFLFYPKISHLKSKNFSLGFRSGIHSPFCFTEAALYIQVFTLSFNYISKLIQGKCFYVFIVLFQRAYPLRKHVHEKELTIGDLYPTSLNKFKRICVLSRSLTIGKTLAKSYQNSKRNPAVALEEIVAKSCRCTEESPTKVLLRFY